MLTYDLKEFLETNYKIKSDLNEIAKYIKINKLEEPIKALPDKIKREFNTNNMELEYDEDYCINRIIVKVPINNKSQKSIEEVSEKGNRIGRELKKEYGRGPERKIIILEK